MDFEKNKPSDFYCSKCGDVWNNDKRKGFMYDDCKCGKLGKWIHGVRAPYLHGCTDGPGSCSNEKVFDRPDLAKELAIDLKVMDEKGAFENNHQRNEAYQMLQEAKTQPKCNIDYQKEGQHPLDSKNDFSEG